MTEPIVAPVMTRDPITVRPHTRFKDILELLARHGISAAPVISASGAVIGEVSEVDLLRARRHPPPRGTTRLTAIELMTSPAVTVPPDTTITEATRLLTDSGARRLFVVDDGRLVGVVSTRDALTQFCRPDKDIHAEIENSIFAGPESAHTVRVSVDAGVVQLTGRLPRRTDIDTVIAGIAEIPGVLDIKERTR